MAIMINNQGFDNRPWAEALGELLPEFEMRIYPDTGNRDDIEYAVVWNHPRGDLMNYPNLKAILLLSAGVDFLKNDKLPDIPIIRLVDEVVAKDMAQHALHWIIHFHRSYHLNRKNQLARCWQRYDYPPAEERKIGILGLGEIGRRMAKELINAGFPVQAWVRTYREQQDVKLFIGDDEQQAFFAQTDILISLLPLTPQTHSFLNVKRLAWLPKGAFVINIGRGAVIDDEALKQLLDSGHIEAAALDVFREEPLPEESWMWLHDRVYITPHASGNTYPRSGVQSVAANIRRIENGENPFPIYNSDNGY